MKKWLRRLIPIFGACVIALCAFAGQAQAAFTFHSGFESGAVGVEFSGVAGSPTIVGVGAVGGSDDPNTGAYCMRCNTSAGTAYVGLSYPSQKLSVYIYIVDAPDTECMILGDALGVNVRLNTDRTLELYDTTNSRDIGSTALSLNAWHRVCSSTNSSTNSSKVYLNGNEECAGTITGVDNILVQVGVMTSCSADIYFDDVAGSSDSADTDLGDIRVINGVPIADSATHDDWKDTTDGATTWDDVDEVTASTADFAWFESNGALNQQTWTSDTIANLVGSIDSVQAISSWFYYTTGAGGANEYFTYMRDNGTDYSTAIDDPKVATWVNRYDATMPNGGGAWTEGRADAYEFGMATDDANKDIWCYTAYKMIAFIPSAGACVEDIANTPSSENLGNVFANGTYYAYGSAPSNPITDGQCTFTITNSSGGAVNITIEATNFTGGVGWTLTSGAPGENTVRMTAYYSGQNPASGVVLSTSPQAFISALGDSATKKWDFKFETGTFTDYVQKTSTITITATCS